ncbi:alpha/beta fold hydrolase [Kocuria sp. M1R5S2]|uniref:alpha/beta fold hydrolase n=1 Tax=Kocuria rhizosphaerae TaxID=3376285 RepID=UPI00379BEE7D
MTAAGTAVRGQRRWISSVGVSVISYPAARATGTPVLMLHGIGGSAESCSAAAHELSSHGHPAYSWDAPGYGESADLPEDADHAATVIAVLDRLGLEKVHLFGTSWGGVVAAQVADRVPHRVASLILADSTRGSGTDPQAAAAMLARSTELAELGPREFAGRRAPRLVAPQCPPAVGTAVFEQMTQVRLSGYTAAARMMAATDNTELLTRLTVPTLVLVGELDVVTGVAESERLAALVPGARLTVVPGAGHCAVTERPAAVAGALREFWAETP